MSTPPPSERLPAPRTSRALAQRRAEVRRRRFVAVAAVVVVLALAAFGAWAVAGRGDETGGKGKPPGSSAPAGGGTASGGSTASSSGSGTDSAAGTVAASTTADRPPPSGPPILIGWAGDTVPASDALGLPSDPGVLLGSVSRIVQKPDLMIGNLEGVLTSRGSSKCGTGSPNCYAFRSPTSYAGIIAAAGFDVMNLANNHAADYGNVGLADTRTALTKAHLASTGAPNQITVRTVKGVRIGIIGFASYKWSAPLNNPAKVKALVQKADGLSDIVVVVFHGGAEGSDKQHVPTGTEYQFGENRGNLRAFAKTAVDAGADLVIGSGPHVIRGMQFYKGRLIAYSVGNFVGYRTFNLSGNLAISYVLNVTLNPDGTWVSGMIVPTRLVAPGTAAPDPGGSSIGTVRDLSQEDFGQSAPQILDDGTIKPPAST